MSSTSRGLKHLCPDCGCKYYDMQKPAATCPKCGAKAPPSKLPRSRAAGRSFKGPFSRGSS